MAAKIVFAAYRKELPPQIQTSWGADMVEVFGDLIGFTLVDTTVYRQFNHHYLSQECFALSGWFDLYNTDGKIYLVED